jgi:hypothetical protein
VQRRLFDEGQIFARQVLEARQQIGDDGFVETRARMPGVMQLVAGPLAEQHGAE